MSPVFNVFSVVKIIRITLMLFCCKFHYFISFRFLYNTFVDSSVSCVQHRKPVFNKLSSAPQGPYEYAL